jgi:hypothetical protein
MEVLTVSYDPLIGQMVYGTRPLFEPCEIIKPSQIKSYLQQMQRANYKSEHWVTINGTHVKIDGEGKITAGPSTLTGRGIDHLSDFSKKHEDDRSHSNASHDEHSLTRAARQASQHANREGQTRDEKVQSHSDASHAHYLASRARSKEAKLAHHEQAAHHANEAQKARDERQPSKQKPVRSDESGNVHLQPDLQRPDWYNPKPVTSDESGNISLRGNLPRPDWYKRKPSDKPKPETEEHTPANTETAPAQQLQPAKIEKPAEKPPEKKPGVPGMQQSLLGEDATGQRQLFNYVPPKKGENKPKPATISTLEKISDEQKESKQTALPGQRELTESVKEQPSTKEVATEPTPSKKPSKRSSKDLPHQMSQEEYAKSGAQTFQTEGGHVYSHHEGKTVRVANDVNEYDDKDVRLKNKSDETHYVNPKDSKLIENWQTQPGRSKRLLRENDEIKLTSVNPKTRVRQVDHRIKVASSEPQVGLSPVELSGKSKEGEGWFKNHHPGDTITSMTNPRESHDDFVQAAKEKKETEARAKESATAAKNEDSEEMQWAMNDSYERLMEEYNQANEEYELVREATGYDASDVSRLRNSGRDYDSLRGFDDSARSFASSRRRGSEDSFSYHSTGDESEQLWEALNQKRPKKPTRNSPEVREMAIRFLEHHAKQSDKDDTSFNPIDWEDSGEWKSSSMRLRKQNAKNKFLAFTLATKRN